MPEKETLERAQEDAREGKSPSTQAGEFVKEEMDHIREGKHGAASTKQAIAIGLSKARRAGVKLPAPKEGQDLGGHAHQGSSRSEEGTVVGEEEDFGETLARDKGRAEDEGRSAASPSALSKQAKTSARQRGSAARKQAAKKAVRTKGAAGRSQAAKKAARTRQRRSR